MDLPVDTASMWREQLIKLKKTMERDGTPDNNTIVHFFLCAMRSEFSHELNYFNDVAQRVVRAATEVENLWNPREAAAQAVRRALRQEAFPSDMISRVNLEDIRNVVVFELWRSHASVVDAKLHETPSYIPDAVKERVHKTTYRDAEDKVRLSNILRWLNLARRVICVRGVLTNKRDIQDVELDTCVGSWWRMVTAQGITKVSWDLALDVAEYSVDFEDESTEL